MWIVSWDLFLMKKLLKSEICGSINSTRCALIRWKKKSKKNQTLQLLFMYRAWTVAASLTNAWKKKKKTNRKMRTWFPNVTLAQQRKLCTLKFDHDMIFIWLMPKQNLLYNIGVSNWHDNDKITASLAEYVEGQLIFTFRGYYLHKLLVLISQCICWVRCITFGPAHFCQSSIMSLLSQATRVSFLI